MCLHFCFSFGFSVPFPFCSYIVLCCFAAADFILTSQEVADKVIRQLARALVPALTSISVNVEGFPSVALCPSHPPPIFALTRYFLYVLLPPLQSGQALPETIRVTVNARLSGL
jgi:hypothetical protein